MKNFRHRPRSTLLLFPLPLPFADCYRYIPDNGIDAARRIRMLSPKSNILFVRQESSADVVQEALASGALGYVVKVYAESELLSAVEAVLQGIQFVGSGISGHYVAPAVGFENSRPPQ